MPRYDIILADPPWMHTGSPNKWAAAGKHYTLMPLEEICALPVKAIANARAALFLWATCPRMPDAVAAMQAWGFNYRGVAHVWVKTRKDGQPLGPQGIPPTFVKPVTELLLVGTTNRTGRPFPILSYKQRQLVYAPREEHSKKPDIFRNLIVELCGDRPRIELFARQRVDGWDCLGDAIDGSDIKTSLNTLKDSTRAITRSLVARIKLLQPGAGGQP